MHCERRKTLRCWLRQNLLGKVALKRSYRQAIPALPLRAVFSPGARSPDFTVLPIATMIPSRKDPFVLLDAGASPDVDPEHLVEFAVMGRAFSQRVLGHPNPGVHLLNIGSEEGKGNAFVKQAYKLMSKYDWFRGNIEGKEMFDGNVEVVVCDAFVGNVVLKTSEGVAELMMKMIKEQIPTSALGKLPYLPLRKVMEPLKLKLDYAEYGGSPLLGLNGLCIICHGRSNPKAIRNALLQAQKGIENKLVECMRTSITSKSGEITHV